MKTEHKKVPDEVFFFAELSANAATWIAWFASTNSWKLFLPIWLMLLELDPFTALRPPLGSKVTCMQIMLNMKQQEIMSTHIWEKEFSFISFVVVPFCRRATSGSMEIIYFTLDTAKRLSKHFPSNGNYEPLRGEKTLNFPRHLIHSTHLYMFAKRHQMMKSIFFYVRSHASILKFFLACNW